MEAELQARCLQASQDPEQDEKEWKEFLMIKALDDFTAGGVGAAVYAL